MEPCATAFAPYSASDSAAVLPAWRLGWWCAGALAGAGAQLLQPRLWGWAAYGGVGLLALGLAGVGYGLARRPQRSFGGPRRVQLLLALLVVALLVFAGTGLRAVQQQAQALAPALEGRDVQLVGTIAAMPQPLEGGVRLRVAVQSARLAGQPVQVPGLVDLGWYRDAGVDAAPGEVDPVVLPERTAARLAPGERWAWTVRLKAPHGQRNPWGFDYELWLWEQGVGATGTVRSGSRAAPPQRLERTWAYPMERARQQVRDAIVARLAPDASDAPAQRRAGVVAALVTGDQRAIDRADWDLFRTTGVAHLMSISGLHITMFAWLASALVGALWRRSARLCLVWPAASAGLVGGLCLAWAYALFSGWGVPAQRTLTMLAVVVLLRLSGRRWPWPQVWLLAAAMVALTDPWALLQPGFWLSFVAVGVLFASNFVAGGAYPSGVKGRFLSMIREQSVVTMALTPLGLVFFGQISLVGWVANLLAIPWVTLVVTPLALAGVLAAPLWALAAWAVQGLVLLLQWLAAWPMAALWLPVAPVAVGAVALLGGLWLVLPLPWAWRALGLPLVLPVLLWQYPRPAPGQFELLAADVGQGSAVLVRTATHSLLYDAGPRYSPVSDAGARVLVPLLRAQGEALDVLLLSHSDSDHIGGAAAVLAQQPQARLLGAGQGVEELAALRRLQPCAAGLQWDWDGVRFTVLHPPPGEGGGLARKGHSNAQSCVLRVQAATGAAALLAGDIEQAQEQQLLALGEGLRADVLLVPHHGSKSSSSPEFLDAVRPHTALVQVGYRNRYGHPAPQVLERLHERGVAVVASPGCGAARWSSQQGAVVHCERAERERYWQHRSSATAAPAEGPPAAAP